MIDHTSIAVKDYEKSKELYAKMLAPLGYQGTADMPDYKIMGFGIDDQFDFWVGEKEASSSVHVAFRAKDKETVEAFHEAVWHDESIT